jgi:6-phosphogluconate dehydrogenase
MKLGFIGLGKMGSQMVVRLIKAGHEVIVTDLNQSAVDLSVGQGAIAATNREDLVSKLDAPAVVWLMIPSQLVDPEIDALLTLLPKGSIIIDGGNSDYRLTRERATKCTAVGIELVDVGTSGGVLGLEQGFSMMIGGDAQAVATVEPALQALAQPDGYKHLGAHGAGHFTKMVHNAIEYGMMEAYAEGYRLLREAGYPDLDLAAVADVWQHGSIIASSLNHITGQALQANPQLDGIEGFVAESGEARWALETAKDHQIELPVIQASFDVRLRSQQGTTNFATKLLAAMRNIFGGHALNK